jgi:hypothetical protein
MDAKGWHHFWIGIIGIVIGLILLTIGFCLTVYTQAAIWICWTLLISGAIEVILGLVICVDDLYQHIRQRKEPAYRSPLHRFYGAKFWNVGWIQRLNQWADKKFGGE